MILKKYKEYTTGDGFRGHNHKKIHGVFVLLEANIWSQLSAAPKRERWPSTAVFFWVPVVFFRDLPKS